MENIRIQPYFNCILVCWYFRILVFWLGDVMLVKNYRDLEIWQEAMDVCKKIYVFTKNFPNEEKYGLVSQLRRAAVSVPSNIAEGFTRKTFGDKKYFMSVAMSSLAEVETQIELSTTFDYMTNEDKIALFAATEKLGKKITTFITRTSKN